jgi:hypothetical protein
MMGYFRKGRRWPSLSELVTFAQFGKSLCTFFDETQGFIRKFKLDSNGNDKLCQPVSKLIVPLKYPTPRQHFGISF